MKGQALKIIESRRILLLILAIAIAAIVWTFHKIPTQTVKMSTCWVTNFSDERVLVGFSDNVFIGKVKNKKGTKKDGDMNSPLTYYEVQVIENIKGSLNGTAVVAQDGGYIGRSLYLVENDKLLQKDKTYMFSGRYDKTQKWVRLVPFYGNDEVKESCMADTINRFKKAYSEEIPFTFDKK